jgi:hypothetical protein
MHKLIPVTQLKEASTGTFFDKSHKRANDTRLSVFGYQTENKQSTFFVESSKPPGERRMYTIYRFSHITGGVELCGNKRRFTTARGALKVAKNLAGTVDTAE